MSTSGFDNDFEIAIGAVFDDAASQRVIREFLNFAAKVEKEQQSSVTKQIRMAEKFASDRIKAEAAAGRKWNDSQKRAFTALLVTTREFLRERAQAEREASQDRRRAYEREEKDRLQANRTADRLRVQQQQQTDRLLFNAEQESAAKRIARSKALYATLASVARSGAQATTNVVTSFFRRRENEAQRSGDRITNIERTTNNRTTTVVRQQLDARNGEYTRAAQRRLSTIEKAATREREVITRNAVKRAEAQAAAQRQLNTGVVGAAARGSGIGAGGIAGILGGGLVGRRIFNTVADFQQIETAFRGIFNEVEGKAPKTTAFLAELQDFAKTTPFALRDLSVYAQKFFANGLVDPKSPKAVAELEAKLLKLADAASATGKTREQVDGAVLGLTQISASGRLSLEDLRQVTEGIGLRLSDVAAELGMTTGDLFKALEKGKVGAVEGIDAIFRGLEKVPGAAGASARQAKNLRGALSNLNDVADQFILRTMKPLGEFLAIAISRFAEFAGKLLDGKGAYKIVRDGLLGVALALGAVIAAKGAVQVISLLSSGLRLLALNPGILVLGALGAAAVVLYRNAPGIRSFFDALVEGTKNWYLVGYRISEPIKNLSNIVLLQSSFGAAARVIVDGFKLILSGVDDLRNGLGTGALEEALRVTLRGLGDALAPARDVVADGLQVIFERGRDFLTQRALPILGEARLNVGSFLLPLLGLTGGDGGVVSRVVTTAITKLFLGSIASFNPDLPAAQLGAKGREIIDRAIAITQRSAVSVQEFFASLFGGDVDFDSFASTLGGRLNDAIGGAFDRLKERLGPINDLLASIGGAIASGFTSYVLPRLIELPRIVGRFISKTVFSEEFLKAVTITAAAIAGVAVVVAGQFVRGFIEGLIERRGDIAKTVIDILGFVAKTVLGSGNPLVVLGGLLVAAFAGAKVLGAISKLRGQFRIAAAGMTGDARKVEAAIERATDPRPATTSKVGNAALRVADGYRKVQKFATDSGKAIEGAGTKTVAFSGKVDDLANRILKLPLGTTVNAAGRLVSSETGRFVKDTTGQLSSLRRFTGRALADFAGELRAAGGAVERFPRQVQAGFSRAGAYAKDMAQVVKGTIPEGFSKAQYAALTGTAAISGYLSGLADDAAQKAAGIVATVSQIGYAFATGGPILGSITAAVGVISYFWGESTRAANKAKEAQKRAAEEAAASAEEIGAAFRAAFKDQGGATSGEGRAAGVLRIIRDLLDVNSKGAKDFADRFKTDMNDVATAASLPRKEFERFTSAVIDRNVSEVLEGNADAIKRFSNQTRIAGQAAVTSFLDSIASKEDSAAFERILQSSGADIIDLQKKVQTGAISIGEFRDRMVEIGFTTQDADRAYKAYKESLTEAIGNTAGGQFLRNLPGQLYASVRQQGLLNEANAELQSRLEGFGPVAERFSSAWGRIKAAIDKAKEAYLNWVDASTGRKLSRAEAISGLFGAAQDFTTPEEGENSLLAEARQTRARVEAQRVIAGQLQELAKRAAGDPAKLNALINDFFNELRAGTNDKETIDFFNQIQYLTADPQSIQILVDSQPAIEGLNGLETQIRTLLQLPENSPLRVGLEKARNFDEAKMLVTASLTELAKQDPRIQAYIEKNGGFDAVRDQVIADAGFIDSLKPKAEADLDADPFTKKKDLITAGLDELEKRETALRIRPFLVDPTGDWTKLFGIIGLDLSVGGGGSKGGSLPTGGNWGDYGGGDSSRLNPQSNVPPTRPRPLTSGGRRGGQSATPGGAAGGAVGYQGVRDRGSNPGIPPTNGRDAPTPWPFPPNREGSWQSEISWYFYRAFIDAFKPKETFSRIGRVVAFGSKKLGVDLERNLDDSLTLTGERLGAKVRAGGLDATLGAWRSVRKAVTPITEGPVGGPQNLSDSVSKFRALADETAGEFDRAADEIGRLDWLGAIRAAGTITYAGLLLNNSIVQMANAMRVALESVGKRGAETITTVVGQGVDAAVAAALGQPPPKVPFTSIFASGGIAAYASGGITQAHIQRRQRIKYAEPETGGEAYVPRRGNRARSEAITHVIASWLGGKFIPAGRATAMAAGGVWGDTTGLQYRNGRWYDRFGRRMVQAEDGSWVPESYYRFGIDRRTSLRPSSAATNRCSCPESYSPSSSVASRRLSASFSAPRYGRVIDEGRTDTHVRNNWDGSIDVLENGTNKVLEHFSAAIVKLNKIMATVSKSMTFAEAQAAVLAATAAQRERGAGAYARWLEALTRFFSGGNALATIKGTETVAGLDKNPPRRFGGPTMPKPVKVDPTAAVPAANGKATVVINRNLHVENHIDGTKGSTATALEVIRKARDSDFLAGGHTIERAYVL